MLTGGCGPVLTETVPNNPPDADADCVPEFEYHGYSNPDLIRYYFHAARDVVHANVGPEVGDFCDMSVRVIGMMSAVELGQHVCPGALACAQWWHRKDVFKVYYVRDHHESLRHEFLHVMMWRIGVPTEMHHRVMNQWDVYFYPRGEHPHIGQPK
jgi:hypothetical protein